MTVIRCGHGPDPRVRSAHPAHAGGMPAVHLASALFNSLTHWGGTVIGQGGDARLLLPHLAYEKEPALIPSILAHILFSSIPSAANQRRHAWPSMWSTVEPQLRTFLETLETRSGTPALAARVQRQIEQLILRECDLRQGVTIGGSHAVRVDVLDPIRDVVVPEDVERLHCLAEVGGEPFKWYELPAFGAVAGGTIAEALAPDLEVLTRQVLRTRRWTVMRSLRFWRALVGFGLRRCEDGQSG